MRFNFGDEIEATYTRGRCVNLAIALSQLSGWPVCGLIYGDYEDGHVFVEMSPGQYVDVRGVADMGYLIDYWENDVFYGDELWFDPYLNVDRLIEQWGEHYRTVTDEDLAVAQQILDMLWAQRFLGGGNDSAA